MIKFKAFLNVENQKHFFVTQWNQSKIDLNGRGYQKGLMFGLFVELTTTFKKLMYLG